jgi:hypothetical protein
VGDENHPDAGDREPDPDILENPLILPILQVLPILSLEPPRRRVQSFTRAALRRPPRATFTPP